MFFVLSPEASRRAAMELAAHTGWGLNELLELDGEELRAWHGALRAVVVRRRE